MRNPFPKIGKVIKYDFKHSSRKLLPLYGALLVLGLLTGLFANPLNMHDFDYAESSTGASFNIDVNTDSTGLSAKKEVVAACLAIAFCVFSVVCIVMTITAIDRRFKQSMLEDEAYLNLSLPVTMGEHLWGKFIIAFFWLFCCALVNCLSGLLCFVRMGLPDIIRGLSEALPSLQSELAAYNLTIGKCFWTMFMFSIAVAAFFITLIYIVNAVSHLFKKNKGLVKFVTVVALFWINGWIFKLVPNFDSHTPAEVGHEFIVGMSIVCLLLVLISAVYFAVTHYIFAKKLNLE